MNTARNITLLYTDEIRNNNNVTGLKSFRIPLGFTKNMGTQYCATKPKHGIYK